MLTEDEQLRADLAYVYAAVGQTWELANGSEFTGIFSLRGASSPETNGGYDDIQRAELRVMDDDASGFEMDDQLYRQSTNDTWRVTAAPEEDGPEYIIPIERMSFGKFGVL